MSVRRSSQQLEELRQETRHEGAAVGPREEQAEEQYEAKLKQAKKARRSGSGGSAQDTVERDLMDAAVAGDAFNTNTVMDVLRPRASLEEIMDEKGKGTGKFRTVVQYATTDSETGEPLTLSLTARAAVERMQAEPARMATCSRLASEAGSGRVRALPSAVAAKSTPGS